MKKLISLSLVLLTLAIIGFFIQQKQKSSAVQNKTSVNLFYYNASKDRDAQNNVLCSRNGLVAVTRQIYTTNPEDTINLLIRGKLTDAERAQGITTEYPLSDFKLKNTELKNGVLTLTFEDPDMRTSGGSCRAGILWFQIEATAKQFTEVKQVRFLPEELFQP